MKIINEELKTRMKGMEVTGEYGFAYGLVGFPEESQILDDLIKIADERMYIKKREMKECSY